MCGICGCDGEEIILLSDHMRSSNENIHVHEHEHEHEHEHKHEHQLIAIQENVLAKNNSFAKNNRQNFLAKNILALNFIASPGAGKTTLLEKTIPVMREKFTVAVIEGDQQTSLDAERIAKTGASVVQINTGKNCHLDAHQIGHAIEKIAAEKQSIIFIENVGNLICPALFDLGEKYRIVMLSVTEGDDKPLKYPDSFASAHLMIINKIDLLPYVNFKIEKCIKYAKQINPAIEILCLSASNGLHMNDWYDWIVRHHE